MPKKLTIEEQADKLVEKYVNVPDNIRWYINAANFDLYNGPRGIRSDDKYEWRGFIHACNIIKAWFNKNDIGSELWVDIDSDNVSDKEPEGIVVDGEYYEPDMSNIRYYEFSDIKKVIFGVELRDYI